MQAAENGFDTWAPPAAAIVRDFVNSYEPQVDAESFDSPTALRDWFASRGLASASVRFTLDDLHAATRLREGVRALLMTHAGCDADTGARDQLDRLLARLPLRVGVDDSGDLAITGSGTGYERAVAGIVEAIFRCQAGGDWSRLKACARETCRWAFYDASRNHARRWCSMAGCGNYIKMRRRAGTSSR
ncbi:CGNR zinc finger domain-containing protein [Microlunatus soli]|uniref:Putative stress-induced transcription regulator n=1 Tax=Microlunatus soli TaxID=630515 RepID=A0A1H1RMC2_9ACTN|nr:CGNR zinc finger domain-containing protein [Microlunatus soli]SDS36686.1 Putative stress-induced transcription regulator [Microlunatus soli]